MCFSPALEVETKRVVFIAAQNRVLFLQSVAIHFTYILTYLLTCLLTVLLKQRRQIT